MYGPFGLFPAVRQNRPFWRNCLFNLVLTRNLIFIHELPAVAKSGHTNGQLLSRGSLEEEILVLSRFFLGRLYLGEPPGDGVIDVEVVPWIFLAPHIIPPSYHLQKGGVPFPPLISHLSSPLLSTHPPYLGAQLRPLPFVQTEGCYDLKQGEQISQL